MLDVSLQGLEQVYQKSQIVVCVRLQVCLTGVVEDLGRCGEGHIQLAVLLFKEGDYSITHFLNEGIGALS